jgi:N4-gp56 family major capsid protein
MGAAITTLSPTDFANRQQKYFSRQLLQAAIFNLKLGSFGVAKELPANSAASTIRFFRPRRAKKGTATSGPRALSTGSVATGLYTTDGTPLTPETAGAAIGYVDIMLQQRGDVSSVSDIVRAIDLFDTLAVNTKTMGADAALDFDFVCSHAICSQAGTADADGTPNPIPTGQTTMYGSNTSYERFAGVQNTLNSANDFASLAALSNAAARLTRPVHLGVMTRMRGINGKPGIPMINGKFKAILPAEVMGDLRQDQTWVNAAVFNNTPKVGLDQWTEFTLDGCDFVEAQSPFIEQAGTYGQYSPDANDNIANNIYSVIYLGQEAFGVPKLSSMRAGSDPRAPSMIVLDKPDKSDPANQKTVFCWKAFYQAGLLWTNEATDFPHLVVLRCKSTYV